MTRRDSPPCEPPRGVEDPHAGSPTTRTSTPRLRALETLTSCSGPTPPPADSHYTGVMRNTNVPAVAREQDEPSRSCRRPQRCFAARAALAAGAYRSRDPRLPASTSALSLFMAEQAPTPTVALSPLDEIDDSPSCVRRLRRARDRSRAAARSAVGSTADHGEAGVGRRRLSRSRSVARANSRP